MRGSREWCETRLPQSLAQRIAVEVLSLLPSLRREDKLIPRAEAVHLAENLKRLPGQ